MLQREPEPVGAPPTIVYVLAAGHSGSTLLSMLLNAHSRMHALSEIDKLSRYLRDPERGRRPLQSAFWQAVRGRYEASSGRPFAEIELRRPRGRRLGDAELARWADAYEHLARAIALASGKPILVDASKDGEQFELLLRAARFDVRVVELLRDGRGVVHAYQRKYGGFARGYRIWSRSLRTAARMRPRFAPNHWLTLRYEDLARAPADELARVCAFLGVAYEPAMLSFRHAAWEGIAGNRMSGGTSEAIVLDERWRREVSWPSRALFAALGGRRNARNGY